MARKKPQAPVYGMGPVLQAPVKKKPQPAKKAPPPPAAFDFRKADQLRPAVQQAQKRVDAARRALPKQPVPYVPVIQHPTKTQRAAARQVIGAAEKRAAGSGSGAQRLQNLDDFDRLVHTDPRYRAFAEAIDHYNKIETNNRAIREAALAGATGPRKDRIARGTDLLLARAQRDTVKAAPGHSAAHNALATILGATSLGGASAENQFVKNALGDVVNFPLGAVQGAYFTGKAAVDAAHGDTSGAQQILASLQHSALGELVQGNVGAAGRAFVEHPVYSALDFTGLGSIAGRAAGAAARSGVLGEAARTAASTARADLELVPGGQAVSRSYSRNPVLKAAQRSLENARPAPSKSAIDRGLAQAANEFVGTAEGLRRRGREEITRQARDLAPSRRGADRDVVLAAVEGRLRGPATFKEDLVHERDRLNAVYQAERRTMSTRAARENRQQVKALEAALKDPDSIKGAVFASADEYGRIAGDLEKQLISRKALNEDQALAARLRPYAVSRMGARFDPTERAPEALKARHEEARAVEKSAKEKLANVETRVQRLQKQRDQIVARQQVTRGRDQAKAPQTRSEVDAAVKEMADLREQIARAEPGTPEFRGLQQRFADAEERFAQARKANGNGRVALTRAEADRQGELNRATRALEAAKQERKTARAEWKQARRQRVRSNPKRYVTGLVDENGHRISTQDILEHIEANGGRVPAFVSHRSDTGGARSFFVNWFGGRKMAGAGGARTGEATRLGAHDATFRVLEEHLVRQKGLVDAIDSFDAFVHRFGQKRPDGQLLTWKQAEKAAQDIQKATGVEMVPVRAIPAKLSAEDRALVAASQDAAVTPSRLQGLVERRMAELLDPPKAGDLGKPTTVLVPKRQLELFKQHQTKTVNDATRSFQALTGLFRSTVLPFSTKWLTGNTVEGLGRLLSAGSDIGPDYWRGRQIMKALKDQDEEAWRAIDTQLRGGLLYGSKDRLAVRRASEDFDSLALRQVGEVAHAIREAPVFKQTLDAIQAYQRAAFAGNKVIEQAFQTAGIGKLARVHARELNVQWRKALVMQEQAAHDIAKGLLDSKWQNRFARELDDMLGKYNAFSPGLRHVIQTYAPFLPWFLNAVKFVGYTLPVKRPIQTALIAQAELAFQKEIQAQRDSIPFTDAENLKAGIPVAGGTIDIARYTPFGVFTQGPGIIGDPVLPQFSSAIGILQGRSFTGQPLSQQSGEPVGAGKRLVLAAYSLAESVAPGLSIARRAREGGRTAYDDSTIFSPRTKPGTGNSGAARRILDPLRPSPIGGLAEKTTAPVRTQNQQPAQDPIDAVWDRIDAATAQQAAQGDPLDDVWDRIDAALNP